MNVFLDICDKSENISAIVLRKFFTDIRQINNVRIPKLSDMLHLWSSDF